MLSVPGCLRIFFAAGGLLGVLALPAEAADALQESVLRKGVTEWNALRTMHPDERADLSGSLLKGRRLPRVNFSRTDLSFSDISQSDMFRSDFREALLRKTNLSESMLVGCDFSGSDLTGAVLTKATCSKADFSGARMSSTVLRRVDLSKALLTRADLSGADLREASLDYADLSHADLRAANLWLVADGHARFTRALISDETILPDGKNGSPAWADARGAVFISSDKNPDAESTDTMNDVSKPVRAWRPEASAHAYDVDQYQLLRSDILQWNSMRERTPGAPVNLREAPLAGRVLAYADLHNAVLEKASFRRADLGNADLQDALLLGADLRAANLEKADLRRADLRGANLWLANTSRTRFDEALVSAATVLADGKPASRAWAEGHGARFSEDVLPLR